MWFIGGSNVLLNQFHSLNSINHIGWAAVFLSSQQTTVNLKRSRIIGFIIKIKNSAIVDNNSAGARWINLRFFGLVALFNAGTRYNVD